MDAPVNTDRESIVISQQETVVVNTDSMGVVITGIMGPPGDNSTITASSDLDTSELTNGATLVYNASASNWKATNKLENQIIESGQF